MKIALGCDHGGFKLKKQIKAFLEKKGYVIKDYGTFSEESCDYPLYAAAATKAVSQGKAGRAIIICTSGIGNSIVANKFPKVRAALCYNLEAARLSRQHNDANVLVLGAKFTKPGLAKKMVSAWLRGKFLGGRHKRRVNQISEIEKSLVRSEQ